jgi:phage baseplate assembly protein W
MALVTTQIPQRYKDLDLSFTAHPIKKDVNTFVDDTAIINSIKNLILTNHYERPFNPDLGSNVRKLLFENIDAVTAIMIEREITQTITNFEPRVNVIGTTVIPDYTNNGFTVQLYFSIINRTEPITINFFLERAR